MSESLAFSARHSRCSESKGRLEDRGRLTQTLGSVDERLADVAELEHGGGLDVVPLLAGKGIDGLLLQAFLTSGALVLTDGHWAMVRRGRRGA